MLSLICNLCYCARQPDFGCCWFGSALGLRVCSLLAVSLVRLFALQQCYTHRAMPALATRLLVTVAHTLRLR
jgi:hypothetical protein